MEKNIVFLLGGNDLEMAEIKNLLEIKHVPYQDHHLSWGASWDSYKDYCLGKGKAYDKIYGIELVGKIPAANCILIDHHNENCQRPASILQVCSILCIRPSRHQQLVAANDSGYIPGLRAAGATNEEIFAIRKEDRKISGCTEADEANAAAHYEIYGSTERPIYKATLKTAKFAPFIDTHWEANRMYLLNGPAADHKIEVQISGKGAMDYLDKFKALCPNCWYGGGADGYVGGYMDLVQYNILKDIICK